MANTSTGFGTSQKQDKVNPGPPFAAGSARNGLSLDSTGHIVLGNDVNQGGAPAQLLSSREIFIDGNSLKLKRTQETFFFWDTVNSEFQVIADSSFQNLPKITVQDINGNGSVQLLAGGPESNSAIWNPGGGMLIVGSNNLASVYSGENSLITGAWAQDGRMNIYNGGSGDPKYSLLNTVTRLSFLDASSSTILSIGQTGDLRAKKSIRTGAPAGGSTVARDWQLGDAAAPGGLIFDSTNCVEVNINGTIYQLALVTSL